MVRLPSASPLNQTVGSDCPELLQPFRPRLLRYFQRSASHLCSVSEAAAGSLKWNLISLGSYLFVFFYLSLAWCINPGVIFYSSDFNYWQFFSSFSQAVPEFYISHSNLDILFVSVNITKTYTYDTWLRNSQFFWAQVQRAGKRSSLDLIRLQDSCSVNNTDCTLSAGTLI